jgi:peptidoglycan/LPS O-acetylase OafA/YrhL
VYIYAFPVQQLLAVWGAYRLRYWAYLGLGVVGTIPLAVGSWWLVEKNALRLKKLSARAVVRATGSAITRSSAEDSSGPEVREAAP